MDASILQEPWRPLIGNESISLQARFEVEVPRAHLLRLESGKVVARRADCDDVLVELRDGRVAIVHLVWQDGGVASCSAPQSIGQAMEGAANA
jgi:hypothetical protein